MFDVMEIGSRMKRRREELDLTLDDVAVSVGVAKTTILRYENGEISRPQIPVLQSIANALDVRPEWLLAQSEQMEDEDKWDWDGQYLKKLRTNCHATPEDIAFRLAPCLNAPGRLNEHGASLSLILLIEDDARIAYDLAAKVHAQNESRKELQSLCYEAVRAEAEERIAHNDKVLVILAKEAPSGIAGLLAGNLKEEFGRPAIVFCPKDLFMYSQVFIAWLPRKS